MREIGPTGDDVRSLDVLDPTDGRADSQAVLGAWLRLQSALCLAPVLARDCLEATGGDPIAALARSGRSRRQAAHEVSGWIRAMGEQGIRALPITARTYPSSLRTLADPPPVLLIRGDSADLGRPSIAIVGARAATSYGRGVARELGCALAEAGFVVVSGLARGIDAAAHKGALAAGGRTLAVMGSGPDRVYPPEHRELAGRIATTGALISELPLGRPPAAPHFPLRNRLISGLVQAVVVVEARRRSGSLITARHALNQGREVLVVPGRIDSTQAAGSNALLRDGARPVLEPSDVLEAVASPFSLEPGGILASDGENEPMPSDPDQARIYRRLREEPRRRDDLGRKLGWDPGRLALALTGLEIDGWIQADRDGRLHAIPPSRRRFQTEA
jgi:DNA processing protein